MNCGEFQEWLLEADPRLLAAASEPADRPVPQGVVPPDVSFPDHLRTCSSCREAAERVLAHQERLAAGLASLAPALPLKEAAAGAIRESARRQSRRRMGTWLAVAAAMTGVLALRALQTGGDFVPETIQVAASSTGSQYMPEVEAMLDESVLVLETDNANVVVFWFYQGRGE